MVGTLSQSDYRWGHLANQITGACAGGACAGGARAGDARAGDVRAGGVRAVVVGTLSQSDYRWGHSANQITGGDTQPIRLQVRAGGAHAGVVGTLSQSDYTGLRARMCVQGLCAGVRTKGWWGHLANQIMQGCTHRGVRTGGARAGVVGTLSQSDYTGLRTQGVCAQGWWGYLANQIT